MPPRRVKSAAVISPAAAEPDEKKSRPRLSQEDVPGYPLEQALRIPRAIAENYAYKPTRPLKVAEVVGMSPSSGPFRMITGAAVAYGLTTGAAQAPEIGITPLGMRIVRPTTEGDDLAARREALLRPKVVGEFLRTYDGAALPSDPIAMNVLQEKGVPTARLEDVLQMIIDEATSVGFIREWNGKRHVDIAEPTTPASPDSATPSSTLPAATPTTSGPTVTPSAAPIVSVGPGININIEIHIGADASAETIEEIFRNMRRYVLAGDSQPDDDTVKPR